MANVEVAVGVWWWHDNAVVGLFGRSVGGVKAAAVFPSGVDFGFKFVWFVEASEFHENYYSTVRNGLTNSVMCAIVKE